MRKIPIERIISKKEIYAAMFLKLCAANIFEVLSTDTNFLTKLRKCSDEAMVDNCYKSRVASQVTARVA